MIDKGEYVLELYELNPFEGEWGDALGWKFWVRDATAPHEILKWDNGDDVDQWETTKPDLTLGSRQHEWAEVLSGRALTVDESGNGTEAPSDEEVIGKRMRASIAHEIPKRGKRAGQRVAKIVGGLARPVGKAIAPKAGTNGKAAPAMSREEMEAAWRRGVKRAVALEIDGADALLDVDPATLEDKCLVAMLNDLSAAVKTAQAEALA